MGKVNLAWRRAAQTLRLPPGEVEAGWPETLTVEQIVTLQSDDRKERRVIAAHLVADCQTGELVHTETYSHHGYKFIAPDKWIPLETVPYYAEEIRFDSSGKWRERYTVKRYKTIPSTSVTLNEKPKDYRTTYYVTGPAVAQWMKDNDLVPSAHMKAWIDAFGVSDKVAPVPAVAAGADEEPTNWSQLVAFRKKYAGDTWKQEQKKILLNEFNRRSALPGAKSVADNMAGELDLKVDWFNKLKRGVSDLGMREMQRKIP